MLKKKKDHFLFSIIVNSPQTKNKNFEYVNFIH